ncbi:MAG: hypothetical protein AB7K36_14020, partial [Chloroflexota bacterium]
GDTLLLLLNADLSVVPFVMPKIGAVAGRWELLVDTAHPESPIGSVAHDAGTAYDLVGRSLVLLRLAPRP